MTFADDSQGIIGELELLQNDLLEQLDDLNDRVETVIKEWTGKRKTEEEPEPAISDAEGSDEKDSSAKAA